MQKKKIYNLDSTESFSEAKIFGGDPSGIINFTQSNHQWALNIYTLMETNQWFPAECRLGQDKHTYMTMGDEKRYSYDMVLSQLITNDSIQTNQLMDSMNRYITSPVVNAAISLQAYQEANHSKSYQVCVEEVCGGDYDRVYNLHKTEPALARKNRAVADMYAVLNETDDPSIRELQMAAAANQILEELVFPGGFVTMWALALSESLSGTMSMISFIERDETATHVPLFKNIFAASVREYALEEATVDDISCMILDMVIEEKIWTKHISSSILGFSDQAIDLFIEHKGNSVCNNLRIPLLFNETDGGPLMSIVNKCSKVAINGVKTKTNFFEAPVADYSVNTLDDDY